MQNYFSLHKKRELPILGAVLAIILMVIGNSVFTIPFIGALLFDQGIGSMHDMQASMQTNTLNNNLLLFLMALGFVGLLVGLYFAMRWFHKSSFITLFSSDSKIDWSRIFYGFGVWFILALLMHVVDYYWVTGPEEFTFQFDLLNFLILILVAVVMLGIQTATEELIFRGYLVQVFGRYINIPIIPIILSGALFGLMHIANPEVAENGVATMMMYYIGVGVVLGLVVFLDNRIELAIGFHAANNIFTATIANYHNSALRTDALFLSDQPADMSTGLIAWYISAFVFVLIVQKKYPFKKKLSALFNSEVDVVEE